ncbi:hypothetical protein N7478_002465 [Penicillium angulare]|uniref:uncharacterized protein n=1 Tax=Penicillium angulare TaxID=116970 RepID=UPI002540C5E6|nr:uncharacterized protein N7478_002465 [Penicillium angulare]KAJ5286779.1 hypothetical protein N7478_002465 [Penicillium angulare]
MQLGWVHYAVDENAFRKEHDAFWDNLIESDKESPNRSWVDCRVSEFTDCRGYLEPPSQESGRVNSRVYPPWNGRKCREAYRDGSFWGRDAEVSNKIVERGPATCPTKTMVDSRNLRLV